MLVKDQVGCQGGFVQMTSRRVNRRKQDKLGCQPENPRKLNDILAGLLLAQKEQKVRNPLLYRRFGSHFDYKQVLGTGTSTTVPRSTDSIAAASTRWAGASTRT